MMTGGTRFTRTTIGRRIVNDKHEEFYPGLGWRSPPKRQLTQVAGRWQIGASYRVSICDYTLHAALGYGAISPALWTARPPWLEWPPGGNPEAR